MQKTATFFLFTLNSNNIFVLLILDIIYYLPVMKWEDNATIFPSFILHSFILSIELYQKFSGKAVFNVYLWLLNKYFFIPKPNQAPYFNYFSCAIIFAYLSVPLSITFL